MKYLLSFECKIKHTHTSYPRWWEFWKKPLVRYSNVWTRKVIPITEQEYNTLCTLHMRKMLLIDVLVRSTATTPEVRNIQVEEIAKSASD